MIKNTIYVLSLFFVLFLLQCKPDKVQEKDISYYVTLAEDEAFAIWVYNDILQLVFKAQSIVNDSIFHTNTTADTLFTNVIEPCYIIHADNYLPDSLPKTISITFMDSCKDLEQISRRDSITFKTFGIYTQNDTLIKIFVNNYSVNNVSIKGDITVEKISDSTSAFLNISLSGGEITVNDSVIISREFTNLEYIWQARGDTTATFDDDIFKITGTYSGNNSTTGMDYINTINDTLEFKMNCAFIQSGICELKFKDMSPLNLDFGHSACDNLGEITFDGVSKEFISDYRIFRAANDTK